MISKAAVRRALKAAIATAAVVGALSLTACSGGGSGADDADGNDTATETGAVAEPTIELFPLPTQTAEPTPNPEPTPADSSADSAASVDTETPVDPRDEAVIWTHIDDFDLAFTDGRPDLAAAVDTFYEVGGGDIQASVDSLLDSIDHPLGWQDAADAAVATFPEGLGEASGVFALLSTQWAIIGCESHLAGMNTSRWGKLLFDHLVAEAANLPADQADNQAGTLLAATNAAIAELCPRLIP